MISAGLNEKRPIHRALDRFLAHGVRAEGVDVHADRIGITDGVGELDLATRRQTGRDHVLRDPASHVSGAAIDFARVLAGKRAAAVPAPAAVAVHDNLAAGQAGVALRSADDETAGRIDEKLRRAVDHRFRQHLADDFLDAEFLDLRVLDFSSVCWVEMTTLEIPTGLPFS